MNKNNGEKMKSKYWFVIISALFIIGLLSIGYFRTEAKTNSSVMTGGDRDAHGCIGSAGYIWCEYKSSCARPWELSASQKISLDEQAIHAYCNQNKE